MRTCRSCDVDHRAGSPECPAQRIGATVAGKYELIDLLGVGGMGAVYRAQHKTLGTMVALKMIHASLASNDSIIARFDAEARRAASLKHPGIVDVTDLGRDADGSPYLEMELLHGDAVVDLVRRGNLSQERAVDIMIDALDALAFAHGRGVIHRDLKPENLFIANTGDGKQQVKILDFGIAKALQESGDAFMTKTGTIMGTPMYMSPEQLRDSKNVDERADVYSMGASLYEMLTADHIVRASTATEVMSRILLGEIDRHPRGARATVPKWLDAIVARALAMKREDRFATAAEMRDALADGVKANPPPPMPDVDNAALATTAAPDSLQAPPASPESIAETSPSPVTERDEHRPQVVPPAPAEPEPALAAAAVPAPSVVEPPPSKTPWILGGVGLVGAVAIGVFAFGGDDNSSDAKQAADAAVHQPAAEIDGATERPSPQPPEGMAFVPGASFQMGSSPDQIAAAKALCRRDAGDKCPDALYEREQPRRTVEVSGFFMDIHEVTNRDYAKWLAVAPGVSVEERAVVAKNGPMLVDLHPDHSGLSHRDGVFTATDARASQPVVQVTWYGADRYCKAMGKVLPSEAQWELAARGSDGRAFPWGDDDDPACDKVVYARRKQAKCADAGNSPQDVGTSSMDRTPEGITDLGGNVGEWVRDSFAERYDAGCKPCKDPVVENDSGIKVARGGYFDGHAESMRAAGRSRFDMDTAQINIGFRCAKPAAGGGN